MSIPLHERPKIIADCMTDGDMFTCRVCFASLPIFKKSYSNNDSCKACVCLKRYAQDFLKEHDELNPEDFAYYVTDKGFKQPVSLELANRILQMARYNSFPKRSYR